jgi:FtsH-binding integral membrane protein
MDHMAQFDNRSAQQGYGARTDVAVDEGLRAYMLRVYNYMAAGIALTGIVAYVLFTFSITTDPALAASSGGRILALHRGMYLTPFGQLLYVSPLKWVIMLLPLGFVFFLSWRIYQMSVGAAQIAFWVFAAAMGASLSSIFLVYTGQSITQVFFVTAASFGALSLWGYTTKKDLSGWGSFLIMGLFGVIIASLVNLFLQSGALQFAISVIGVLVFAGLTAYDTQRIKDTYYEVANDATAMAKGAIMGALNLYLDFINMFVMMLQLFGNRE